MQRSTLELQRATFAMVQVSFLFGTWFQANNADSKKQGAGVHGQLTSQNRIKDSLC